MESTHIKVRVLTRDRLLLMAAKMADAWSRTGSGPITPVEGRISLDALVAWLMDQTEKHRERARLQKRRKAPPAPPSAN